jgi:hypothetical protein
MEYLGWTRDRYVLQTIADRLEVLNYHYAITHSKDKASAQSVPEPTGLDYPGKLSKEEASKKKGQSMFLEMAKAARQGMIEAALAEARG